MAASKDNLVDSNCMSEEDYKRFIEEKNKTVKELYNNIPSGKRKSGKFWKNQRNRYIVLNFM